ncbi:hypothetical protein CkaCkLH20_05549 [Colletotrichum karsti]|uniref:Uncharacterized protein n=1 Tax=Colletotrichum karsti TaxID=1095194 RepID=A0A9P6LKF5_9PEZI|nr:uncharacterized protein CkaCkLH20_05549 [Colletotrichum karsti]KAF9876703.1 hypothetical protein CkaCkLH20_05549 [Colletotrichum karsti]
MSLRRSGHLTDDDEVVGQQPVTVAILNVVMRRYLDFVFLEGTERSKLAATRKIAIAALVLTMSETASRGGDVTISQGYDEANGRFQFFRWEDVKITVQRDNAGHLNLLAQITLRYEKFNK